MIIRGQRDSLGVPMEPDEIYTEKEDLLGYEIQFGDEVFQTDDEYILVSELNSYGYSICKKCLDQLLFMGVNRFELQNCC
ncbi:hypothetical protein [Globicatella sanguinis]|uniref:hypothetical protein n=1 Tax=Globicatella sanguinis TaxID=13076 RepID=UPI000824DC6D|nr:hypothetical protein [Globicatella sanguinis]